MPKKFLRTVILTAFILVGLAGTKPSGSVSAMMAEQVEEWIRLTKKIPTPVVFHHYTSSESNSVTLRCSLCEESILKTKTIDCLSGTNRAKYGAWDTNLRELVVNDKRLIGAYPYRLVRTLKELETKVNDLRAAAKQYDAKPKKVGIAIQKAGRGGFAAAKAELGDATVAAYILKQTAVSPTQLTADQIKAKCIGGGAGSAAAAPSHEAQLREKLAANAAKKAAIESEDAQIHAKLLKAQPATLKSRTGGGASAGAAAGAGPVPQVLLLQYPMLQLKNKMVHTK